MPCCADEIASRRPSFPEAVGQQGAHVEFACIASSSPPTAQEWFCKNVRRWPRHDRAAWNKCCARYAACGLTASASDSLRSRSGRRRSRYSPRSWNDTAMSARAPVRQPRTGAASLERGAESLVRKIRMDQLAALRVRHRLPLLGIEISAGGVMAAGMDQHHIALGCGLEARSMASKRSSWTGRRR